jgi:hypothetical protein
MFESFIPFAVVATIRLQNSFLSGNANRDFFNPPYQFVARKRLVKDRDSCFCDPMSGYHAIGIAGHVKDS